MNSTKEKTNRAIKYVLMALITAILVRYIPTIMVSDKNIIIISTLVSISYAMLDRISPSIR
tara:strand:- start:347 stop:529 length:183 start_codon:yes stop_codon:yes gene_type:complete